MKRISVLLVDDHAIVREGLRLLLEDEADIEVVGEAKNGRQAVELTQQLRPAVVVMDIAMPLLNGLDATRIILKTLPLTKVIILSAHGDDAYLEEATKLGAAGYLLKQFSPRLLPHAIRDVQKGHSFVCPANGKLPCARPLAEVQAGAEAAVPVRKRIIAKVGKLVGEGQTLIAVKSPKAVQNQATRK